MANKKKKQTNRITEILKANEKVLNSTTKNNESGNVKAKNLKNNTENNLAVNNTTTVNSASSKNEKKTSRDNTYDLPIYLIKKDLKKTLLFSLFSLTFISGLAYFNVTLEDLIVVKESLIR